MNNQNVVNMAAYRDEKKSIIDRWIIANMTVNLTQEARDALDDDLKKLISSASPAINDPYVLIHHLRTQVVPFFSGIIELLRFMDSTYSFMFESKQTQVDPENHPIYSTILNISPQDDRATPFLQLAYSIYPLNHGAAIPHLDVLFHAAGDWDNKLNDFRAAAIIEKFFPGRVVSAEAVDKGVSLIKVKNYPNMTIGDNLILRFLTSNVVYEVTTRPTMPDTFE